MQVEQEEDKVEDAADFGLVSLGQTWLNDESLSAEVTRDF